MTSGLKNRDTRCNFCSLGCSLRLTQTRLGYLQPDYNLDVPEVRRGVCGRGNMTAELLVHVGRLCAAKLAGGEKPREVPLDEAIQAVAKAAGSGVTLVIDGNLPSEDIAAGLAAAAASKDRITAGVYLPNEDEAALDGLAASGARLLTPEEIADSDAVLIVGDAFATHPVISRAVHALRKKHARTPLVVIDSLPGKTSVFASHPLIVRPGTESRVLAAIAGLLDTPKVAKGLKLDVKRAAAESGVAEGALSAAANAIAPAKKLAVLLRAEIGKAPNWDQVALLSGLIAAEKGGGVLACLTYGNALGAYRLAGAAPRTPAGPRGPGGAGVNLEKPRETVLVLGTDVVSVLSTRESGVMLEGIRTLAAAAGLPSPTLGAADVALPMGFNFETGGTTVTGSGEVIAVASVADPPGEATSAGDLVMRLAEAMGISGVERKVDVKVLETMPRLDAAKVAESGHPEIPKSSDGKLLAVTTSDAIHFHTGSLTRLCAWAQYMAPEPRATLNPVDAASLGLADGDPVVMKSSEGEGRARVKIAKGQPTGVVALCCGFTPVRRLFPWDMAYGTGPVAVTLEKAPK